MNLTILSAKKLRAEIEKRTARQSITIDKMIEAGRGNERYDETVKAARDSTDTLANEYLANMRAYVEACDELARRMKWHGSDKRLLNSRF